MDDILKKELYDKLDCDKVKISGNKNLIKMDTFLKFLKVNVIKIEDNLGSCLGWTEYQNKELHLYIGGGIVRGIDYLNSIEYGVKLHNPYNNYITPFHMSELLTKKGIQFFYNYYKTDIEKIIEKTQSDIEYYSQKLKRKNIILKALHGEYNKIFNSINKKQ